MKLHPDKYRGEVNLHEQSNKSHKQKSSVLKIFKLMWYMVTNVVFRIEARKKKGLNHTKQYVNITPVFPCLRKFSLPLCSAMWLENLFRM